MFSRCGKPKPIRTALERGGHHTSRQLSATLWCRKLWRLGQPHVHGLLYLFILAGGVVMAKFRHALSILAASWSSIGVVISFLGLLVPLAPHGGFSLLQWFLIVFVVAVGCFAAFKDVQRNVDDRVLTFTNDSAIDRYMRDWIACDGRVAIFSNDLSWVQRRKENMNLLERKAHNGELTLYLPKPTETSNHLQGRGARVCTYAACLTLRSHALRL